MQCRVLKPFHSPRIGNCNKNDVVNIDDGIAKKMIDAGYIEAIETKPNVVKTETKPKPKTRTRQTKK